MANLRLMKYPMENLNLLFQLVIYPLSVSDLLSDRQNSIYVPAAARERRVELVEIKVE